MNKNIELDIETLRKVVSVLNANVHVTEASLIAKLVALLPPKVYPKVGKWFKNYCGEDRIILRDDSKYAVANTDYVVKSNWYESIEELCEACGIEPKDVY